MDKQLQFIVNSACLILILAGIQNCAPFEPTGFVDGGGQGGTSAADLQAADSFSKTVQPTLLTNCASCHDGNQAGAPAFAVPSALSGSQTIMKNGLVNMVMPASSMLVTKLEAGHHGTSAAVTSEVAGGVQAWVDDMNADRTAPAVRITSPTGGSVVSATVMITATASDNVGVVGVQFMIDGVDTGTEDVTEPFTTSIDTLALANRAYKLTARARDAVGFMTTSAAVTVTVNNPPPNPNATFAWINTNILMPRCIGCHGSGRADAGIRYDTYAETMKTTVAGNLAASSLYTSTNTGRMPIGGAKLTAAQIKAIADWINLGAPNN